MDWYAARYGHDMFDDRVIEAISNPARKAIVMAVREKTTPPEVLISKVITQRFSEQNELIYRLIDRHVTTIVNMFKGKDSEPIQSVLGSDVLDSKKPVMKIQKTIMRTGVSASGKRYRVVA